MEIVTPFTFRDGNGIEIFAREVGTQVHFFDDGLTLLHLHSAGFSLGANKKKWQPLRAIAENFGVTLSDNGVFEMLCPRHSASHGFAKIMSALLGIASWERENAGVSLDAGDLVEEVAIYLQAWKPAEKIIERPSVLGFSGRKLTFNFEMGGEYIDAIQPHSASTGAELRKLVDLNSAPDTVRKEVLIIVDDRRAPESAKQEIGILGRVAKVWPMSSLITAAGESRLLQ